MFAKWTRPHSADDAETWTETELTPTISGWEERHEVPPVLVLTESEAGPHQQDWIGTTDDIAPTLAHTSNTHSGHHEPKVLISSTGDSPARTYQWQATGRVLGERAAVSGLSSIGCCENCGHDGQSLKMFPVSLAQMAAEISSASSWDWKSSGSGGPTQFWTRAGSESRNAADACSLSDVLETRTLPRRYWLSARAAAGILRRAAKRGKELPPALMRALQSLARSEGTTAT